MASMFFSDQSRESERKQASGRIEKKLSFRSVGSNRKMSVNILTPVKARYDPDLILVEVVEIDVDHWKLHVCVISHAEHALRDGRLSAVRDQNLGQQLL